MFREEERTTPAEHKETGSRDTKVHNDIRKRCIDQQEGQISSLWRPGSHSAQQAH